MQQDIRVTAKAAPFQAPCSRAAGVRRARCEDHRMCRPRSSCPSRWFPVPSARCCDPCLRETTEDVATRWWQTESDNSITIRCPATATTNGLGNNDHDCPADCAVSAPSRSQAFADLAPVPAASPRRSVAMDVYTRWPSGPNARVATRRKLGLSNQPASTRTLLELGRTTAQTPPGYRCRPFELSALTLRRGATALARCGQAFAAKVGGSLNEPSM